jgi:hypothetical protein
MPGQGGGRAIAVGVTLAVLAAASLGPGGPGLAEVRGGWTAAGLPGIRLASAARTVRLSGWFHVIQNGETRFFLVDDGGVAIRLLIDEPVMRAFGGPRRLDRRRVTIEGQRGDDAPDAVRVRSIELNPGGR